jgi:hypothetical protein
MISHPLSCSRSGIVDQGPVCRARGRTRRTSARHFPRVGRRPAVHGFTPCRLHAAALFCASKASTVAAAIRARDFVKRPLACQIKRHQGKIAPSIILRGGALLQCRGQARRSAQNVRRVGSSWAHTVSIHRLRVLSGRRSSSTGAHHFDPGHCWQAAFWRRRGRLASCQNSRPVPAIAVTPLRRADPSQAMSGTKRRQRDLPCPRTESSNPFPSSRESSELPTMSHQ